MNEIKLYGSLAHHGESFKCDVRDPIEAYKALSAQLTGFREEFKHGEYYIIREMPNSKLALTEEMLFLGMDNGVLHFLPCIEGSASQKTKGTAKTVLGVAVFVGSLFIPGSSVLLGMSVRAAGMLAGAALAFGGASLLLTPSPKLSTGSGDDSSKLINGDFNPSGQNFAVPIVVGKWRRKGIPIASELVTNEYNVTSGSTYDNGYAGIGGDGGTSSGSQQNRT